MEDIIDQGGSGSQGVPQAVKTLGILSIVGSSLWGLILLIAMFWLMGQTSGASILPGMGDLMALIYIVFILMILLNVLGVVGAMKMMKGSKGGFILYAVVTGLWALLLLLGSVNNPSNPTLGVLCGIISIGFIVAFGMQMKKMS